MRRNMNRALATGLVVGVGALAPAAATGKTRDIEIPDQPVAGACSTTPPETLRFGNDDWAKRVTKVCDTYGRSGALSHSVEVEIEKHSVRGDVSCTQIIRRGSDVSYDRHARARAKSTHRIVGRQTCVAAASVPF